MYGGRALDISCAFATSLMTPSHVELAEELGYQRAWLYDSPAVYPDVWMVLGQCAARTSRIGLGPAVLVPSLRHPMVNASAIATLSHWAPGRIAVTVGTGFSGRLALGERPMRWNDVALYVKALRSLLRGDETQWNGVKLRMLHSSSFAAARPLNVPILIAAAGPKGRSVADELGDGVFTVGEPHPEAVSIASWRVLLNFGTVLDDGEAMTSPRVLENLAPAAAVQFHGAYERGGAGAVDALPGGRAWRELIESIPAESRHLAVHAGHLVEANEQDREHVGGLFESVIARSLTGSPTEVAARLEELDGAGITEVAYQPAGPNVERELRTFASAAGISVNG
jgi:5,10-methylenetetrahydromethanopterin reductase